MSDLGYELFVLVWVLSMLGTVAWGWARGDFDRGRGSLFTGMFLSMMPMVVGTILDDLGLTGRELTAAYVGLAVVGLAGLGLAVRGYRMDESGGGDGRDGSEQSA